jgi:hypothetical protein
MKLTAHKTNWVLEQVANYSKQIGIPHKDVPKVVFSRKGVLELPRELTEGRRTVTHKCLGICFRKAKAIFISVKKHKSLRDLKDTIVHELVHYRFRYLKHGRRFEDRIYLIVKKEKRYPHKELYPENEIRSSSAGSHTTLNAAYLQEEPWTTERVKDELHYYLERFKDKNNNRKYEEQARRLIYKIPIYRPTPPFIVDKKDLSTRLIIELQGSAEKTRNEILKSAVGRIFENIDERYYIQSVKKLLNVELRE